MMASLLVIVHFARLVASYQQTTWASVVMAFPGEREPILSVGSPALTPLGAQQALMAGSTIRTRYIQGLDTAIADSHPIKDISSDAINNGQLYILATEDDYVAASAQAFMQGVYPPFRNIGTGSTLANGTSIQFPLGGYQYPTINLISPLDFNYVWVAGDNNCPQYEQSLFNYFDSQEYKGLAASTLSFYQGLIPSIFHNVVPDSEVGFYNAYTLYDFANFQYTHNESLFNNVKPSSIAELRALASSQQFSLNGNLSASGLVSGDKIRAVAGRMFASKVLSMLRQNMGSSGVSQKLSIFFGGYEPFLAFFALSGLFKLNPLFQSLPEPGSLMVFEIFSTNPNATSYPSIDQLWVRFLFRNGTDEAEPLISYPLFGRGNSETDMRWADFETGMADIMISDIGAWCNTCGSNAIYCRAFLNNQSNSTNSTTGGPPCDVVPAVASYSKMSLVTAGVIGATATIAVTLLLIIASALCGGVRFYRNGSKRQPSLGGFKGAGKLASDADLTHTVARDGAVETVVKHEREGSSELGNVKKIETKNLKHESIDRVVSTADYSQKGDDDNISAVDLFGDSVKIDDQV